MTTVEEHIDKLEEATKVLEARLQTATATLAREIKSLQDEHLSTRVMRLEDRKRETHTGD
tara:strand:+ start:323 stop:502 length:180 start_codon:yes stop_codon:yes gene_type:complete